MYQHKHSDSKQRSLKKCKKPTILDTIPYQYHPSTTIPYKLHTNWQSITPNQQSHSTQTTTHNLYLNSVLSTRGNHVQHSSQDSRSTKTRLHALQRFDCCVCSLLLLPQSFVWDVRLKTTSLVRQKTMLHLRTTGPPRCVHVASKLRV